MPVNNDYAARTVCRNHGRICTKELRGSMRMVFCTGCDAKHDNFNCKFSHTIFNTSRVMKLGGGDQDFHVKLDYGYGFERYGAYDGWTSGWDVTANGHTHRSPGSRVKTYDFPKALLWAESQVGLTHKGDPDVTYDKVQSLCKSHYKGSGCQRADCRYDHDLMDAERIEKLARWKGRGTDEYEYMTLECRATGGRILWKITMKSDAFKELRVTDPIARTIPARPFSLEDGNLLDLVKRVEGVVGLTVSGFSDKGLSNLKPMLLL
ncbi:hypothetical protein BS17DRAFT_702542 [Gyrodon lividus]|nr:hypothetical protein BS17DRAFT_702542 [Gyrodon lividus]